MREIQLKSGRYMLHEHLLSANGWSVPAVVSVVHTWNLTRHTFDMCRFGMTSWKTDKHSDHFTIIMNVHVWGGNVSCTACSKPSLIMFDVRWKAAIASVQNPAYVVQYLDAACSRMLAEAGGDFFPWRLGWASRPWLAERLCMKSFRGAAKKIVDTSGGPFQGSLQTSTANEVPSVNVPLHAACISLFRQFQFGISCN